MGRDIYRYRIMWGTLRGMWQFQHNKKYEEDEEEGATESLMSWQILQAELKKWNCMILR